MANNEKLLNDAAYAIQNQLEQLAEANVNQFIADLPIKYFKDFNEDLLKGAQKALETFRPFGSSTAEFPDRFQAIVSSAIAKQYKLKTLENDLLEQLKTNLDEFGSKYRIQLRSYNGHLYSEISKVKNPTTSRQSVLWVEATSIKQACIKLNEIETELTKSALSAELLGETRALVCLQRGC